MGSSKKVSGGDKKSRIRALEWAEIETGDQIAASLSWRQARVCVHYGRCRSEPTQFRPSQGLAGGISGGPYSVSHPRRCFRAQYSVVVSRQALLGEQVLSGLSAIFSEFETDLDTPAAFGVGALGFERIGHAMVTFVAAPFREVSILGTRGGSLGRLGCFAG